jgi:signal transduction histidine kinase
MTDNFRKLTTRRPITLEVRHDEAPRETLDRLRLEVAELRASRKRLVLAADVDRRRIERALHEGVQQDLVALAVNLQRADQLVDADPGSAKELLEEMSRDVQQALDETAQLAERIYPPLLETGVGLAAALRSAATSAGVRASVDVESAGYPPEAAATVHLCCLGALEHADAGARVTVTVREEDGALAFEIVEDSAAPAGRSDAQLDRLRDRVEALGGRLTRRSEPGGGTRTSGSLPLAR